MMRRGLPTIVSLLLLLATLVTPPRPPAAAPLPALPVMAEPAPGPSPRETEPALPQVEPGRTFDLVIRGGRVMDPETGLDTVANVGIDGERITAVSTSPLQGRAEIDAAGRVVAPGFIDILSYDPNPYGIWYKIADGVTTNLGMHGVGTDPAGWLRRWEQEGSPAHFGGALSYNFARANLGASLYAPIGAARIAKLKAQAAEALQLGFIGIDMSLEYAPGITYDEVRAMGQVAAEYGVPLFFHGRYSDMQEPGTNRETLAEILRVARETGAAVHVEHINSTGGTFAMNESLATLAQARAEGVDVTACTYPYDFWATYLGSARFDPGWQERFQITYADLEIAGTGERLTAESFQTYRKHNKLAVAYAIPAEDVRAALRAPFVMIGSDAILEPGNNNHPRSTGTYARVLGRYVREEQVLTLMEALAKMTILPARRLQAHAPALRRKGRLQAGADADIAIFDPAAVRDRSTVRNPAQYSEGIDWVLVLGQVVKDPAGLRRDVKPGRPVKSAPDSGPGARTAGVNDHIAHLCAHPSSGCPLPGVPPCKLSTRRRSMRMSNSLV